MCQVSGNLEAQEPHTPLFADKCRCASHSELLCSGAHVTIASVEEGLQVTCSRGVRLTADAMIDNVADQAFDLIALPVLYFHLILLL